MRFSLFGGAALALVAAAAMWSCGGSSSMATSPTSPSGTQATADVTITINGMNGSNSFSPNPGTLKAGQTVAWKNADSTAHTATADSSGGFNTGTIAPGATSSPIMFSAAGTISYHCSIHPSMVGSLTVQ